MASLSRVRRCDDIPGAKQFPARQMSDLDPDSMAASSKGNIAPVIWCIFWPEPGSASRPSIGYCVTRPRSFDGLATRVALLPLDHIFQMHAGPYRSLDPQESGRVSTQRLSFVRGTKMIRPCARILLVVAATAGSGIASVSADDTGMASIHDLRREKGRLCMSDHWHYGSGVGGSKKAAQADAIGSWQSFTALEYGSDWARFKKAASQKIECSESGSGYSCSVEARPCK